MQSIDNIIKEDTAIVEGNQNDQRNLASMHSHHTSSLELFKQILSSCRSHTDLEDYQYPSLNAASTTQDEIALYRMVKRVIMETGWSLVMTIDMNCYFKLVLKAVWMLLALRPSKNTEITIKDILKDVLVFHAGTKLENGKLLTSGGRVLAASATNLLYVKPLTRLMLVSSPLNSKAYTIVTISLTGKKNGTICETRAFNYADEQQKETGLSYVAGGVDIDADNLLVEKIKPLIKSTRRVIAQTCGIRDTVGIDLVAMNVNDLTGLQAGAALIGGETAEMSGLYELGDYNGAVFSVGAVERSKILARADSPIKAGDVLLGLASSGVYLSGFSLVRTIIATQPGLPYQSPSPWKKGTTLGRDLLTTTRIYGLIKGMVHITGGGFLDNIPKGLGVIFTIGIVLAHINELAPANFRGLMPGLAYQLVHKFKQLWEKRYPLRNSDGSLQLRDGKSIPDYGLPQAIFMGCVVACLIITTLLKKEKRNKDFMQNLYEDKNE
ncbi:hypothetical protein BDC45DRAFT_578095 [Circinella umbellata]|nr:hypothetical protein BDC45DRAFT_578095 [Circinella umbellata]